MTVLTTADLQGQFISNSHFENWIIDPVNMQTGQIFRCQDWIRVSSGDTDPDYFHRDCQTVCGNASADVPQNQRGFALGFGHSLAYAGVLTRHIGTGWYEYIRGTVTGLTIGKRYNVRFYVHLGQVSHLAFNGLQACITELDWLSDPNQLGWTGQLPPQYEAQIRRPPGHWVDDPSGWHEVTGSFVASAATEFIYVGYFGDITQVTPNTAPLRNCIAPLLPTEIWTHYYVDAFSISEAAESRPECCIDGTIELETSSTANCCIEVKLTDHWESGPDRCGIGGVRVSIDENYLSQFSPPTSRLIRTDNTSLWDATLDEELTAVTWRDPNNDRAVLPGQTRVMGVFCLNNPLAGAFYIPVVIEILGRDGVTVMCKKTILVDCDPV